MHFLSDLSSSSGFNLVVGICGILGMIASFLAFRQAKATKKVVNEKLYTFQIRKKISEEKHALEGALASISQDSLTVDRQLANMIRNTARRLLIAGQKTFTVDTMAVLHNLVDATTPFIKSNPESDLDEKNLSLTDTLVDTIATLEEEVLKSG